MIHQNKGTHFLGSREIRYTANGRKLSELRRAKLRSLAKTLKVSPDGDKNSILHRVIAKLDSVGAEAEIGEIQ